MNQVISSYYGSDGLSLDSYNYSNDLLFLTRIIYLIKNPYDDYIEDSEMEYDLLGRDFGNAKTENTSNLLFATIYNYCNSKILDKYIKSIYKNFNNFDYHCEEKYSIKNSIKKNTLHLFKVQQDQPNYGGGFGFESKDLIGTSITIPEKECMERNIQKSFNQVINKINNKQYDEIGYNEWIIASILPELNIEDLIERDLLGKIDFSLLTLTRPLLDKYDELQDYIEDDDYIFNQLKNYKWSNDILLSIDGSSEDFKTNFYIYVLMLQHIDMEIYNKIITKIKFEDRIKPLQFLEWNTDIDSDVLYQLLLDINDPLLERKYIEYTIPNILKYQNVDLKLFELILKIINQDEETKKQITELLKNNRNKNISSEVIEKYYSMFNLDFILDEYQDRISEKLYKKINMLNKLK